MSSKGVQGGKQKPYAGPMYSGGTKYTDSKENVGPVHGPKGGKSIPDPLGYTKK